MTESETTTTTAIGGFLGHQDLPIHAISWKTADPKAAVIIFHGYGDHSARYARSAAVLNQAGIDVYGMDFQGHGRSGGRRGYIHAFNDWVYDAKTLINAISDRHPDRPIFLLGHSLGGLVIVNALASPKISEKVNGAVLLSPTVAVEGTPPQALIGALEAAAMLLPNLPAGEVDPQKVSMDPEAVVDYASDPFVLHKKIGLRAGIQLIRGAQFALKLAKDVTTPVLVMFATQDELALPEGSQALFAALNSEDKEIAEFSDSAHELLNDLETHAVLGQVVTWIDERI